ncbi:glutamate ligase domain-containing protein, partial [Burkholderia pseudomallei]
GLEAFAPVKGRLQVARAAAGSLAGATVIDDTYNANPDSMLAAIDVLAAQSAPRVLVIGEMGEVGDEGPAFHREIGAYARERGIDALFALGAATRPACDAYGAGARHFDDAAALVAALLAANFGAHATLLVKGSRFMKMERVVDALANETASGAAPGAH